MPDLQPTEKPAARADKARQRPDYVWAITDHVCRVCFSRVLVRETFDRRRIYRCSNCGIEAEGKTEAAVCCCGVKLKTGVDAGIRCIKNDAKSPEWPSEVVAMQAGPPGEKPD